MNGALVVLGMVVVSIVLSAVVYRISSSCDLDVIICGGGFAEDQSSLNEDLQDILGFVPLDEVDAILESFIKYDRQIGDVTVGYINDNAKYIAREFNRIPEFERLLRFLGKNRLDLEYWHNEVTKRWKDIPTYLKTDTSVACGGLPTMMSEIMETIPWEELHELLCQKLRYSASFKRFVENLRSDDFEELCDAVKESKVLQQHYFWANDDGVDVIFGMELLRNLYTYLGYELQ